MGDAWKCETCKWWATKEWLPGWGKCLKASSEDRVAIDPESLFLAQGAECYRAWLDTCSRFGCVCWEAMRDA